MTNQGPHRCIRTRTGASGQISLLLEQRHLDPPEKRLGALGLEEDLALVRVGVEALVDRLAVEDIGDLAAVADDLQAIPFTDGFFDILRAAEALDVLPIWIAA